MEDRTEREERLITPIKAVDETGKEVFIPGFPRGRVLRLPPNIPLDTRIIAFSPAPERETDTGASKVDFRYYRVVEAKKNHVVVTEIHDPEGERALVEEELVPVIKEIFSGEQSLKSLGFRIIRPGEDPEQNNTEKHLQFLPSHPQDKAPYVGVAILAPNDIRKYQNKLATSIE